MSNLQTAVEITRGADSLDIWVDANNNGVRDDDDVNIFISQSGSIYATSPLFKRPLDAVLRDRLRDTAVALMSNAGFATADAEDTLRQLSLALVVKATATDEAVN
jgi:hypothetical protein